jgi:hypothetical protein
MGSNIFRNLQKHWENNGYRYFEDQDIKNAGKDDCEEIFLKDPILGEVKNQLANGLMEIFLESLNSENCEINVINYLNTFKLVEYYFVFVDKINILLREGIITKKELHNAGMNYVKEYEEKEIIKLGLTCLRFSGNDEALEVLKIFSNHNEYAFYAIEGIKEYNKCNSIIFEIAKESRGYGKVFAVTNLEPLTKEIKNWIIDKGSENDFLESMLVAMTFNEYDYINYFIDGRKTRNKFDIFTRNLLELYKVKGFFYEHITLDIIFAYWQYYNKFKKTFDSVYLMSILLSFSSKEEYEEGSLRSHLNLSVEENDLIEDMISEFVQGDIQPVIKDTIKNYSYDLSEVLDLGANLGMRFSFDELKHILKIEPLEIAVYSYIMGSGTKEDKEKLIEYSLEKLSFQSITGGAENITEEDLDVQYLFDTCLFLMIDHMNELKEKYIDFNILALRARYTPTRNSAFNNLKQLPEVYREKVINEIKLLVHKEVDNSIKKSMLRFLDVNNQREKERRYENIESVKVSPHTRDILLTTTVVSGTNYRDLTVVEDKLKEKKLVFLKREKNNPYDSNAIMVLTDDGYHIGYIPRKENYILKNLMDWGKIIYGEIISSSEDCSDIEIGVYLSYIDVMREVTETFNMVSEKPMGYLN